jgi:hypothetical protein
MPPFQGPIGDADCFASGFAPRYSNAQPAVTHIPTAPAVKGMDTAVASGKAAVEQTKAIPVGRSVVRLALIAQGRAIIRRRLPCVKKMKAGSKDEWDQHKLLATIPQDKLLQPMYVLARGSAKARRCTTPPRCWRPD